jgi:hypothetical protein
VLSRDILQPISQPISSDISSHIPTVPGGVRVSSEDRINRTLHRGRTAVQHVRVDLRRRDVSMAEQFLHGADVAAVLQEVGRKRMAKGVRVARLAIPARRAASFTTRWSTDSWR